MTLKTKGVILKISETVHENRLLFILSEERGRIQVFDNHYKSGGKKRSTLDLYTYCEFVLYENNGKYSLNSVTVIENFFALRSQLPGATLAGYFAQICLFATQEENNILSKELCSLMLNSLYLLCNKPDQIHKVKTVFEWKMIGYLGFAPSMQSCAHISYDEGVLLSTEDGGLYCAACVPTIGRAPAFRVSASELKAIIYILEQPPAKAFSFKLPEPSMLLIGKISEAYLQYHTDQSFSALEIYKVLG